jgi:putative Holliday junction resolvase
MRVLGIDYGDVKIGVALSDPLGWTAQGFETIRYSQLNTALDRIISIINEYEIERIVVGMPKNMNGSMGPRSEKTLGFINMLKERTKTEIVTWDERLSTVSAEKLLINGNVKRQKRKGIIDTVAAKYILQNYLDYLSNKNK